MHSLNKLKRLNLKVLVVVAHPDDESLFIGGTIAEFKKWHWNILCITDCDERYNKRRRRELLKVCRLYNRGGSQVHPVMLGIRKRKGRFSKIEIKEAIAAFIDKNSPFDIIFTHNRSGDYDHKTHRLVYQIIEELRYPNVYNFYLPQHCNSKSTLRLSQLGHLQKINISKRSLRIKQQALNIYLNGSQKTNLSKLKKLIAPALNKNFELFIRAN